MSMDSTDDLENAEGFIAELALIAVEHTGVNPWDTYCRPTCQERDEPGSCSSQQEEGTGEFYECGCPCHSRTSYDTESSASRQHYIDTGRYLRADETVPA